MEYAIGMPNNQAINADEYASYVVRVYRRDVGGRLQGIVESVDDGAQRAFGTADELWSILTHVADARHRGPNGPRSKRGRNA